MCNVCIYMCRVMYASCSQERWILFLRCVLRSSALHKLINVRYHNWRLRLYRWVEIIQPSDGSGESTQKILSKLE